ncbi:MAG: DUF2927 domain-containing protein [Methanoregula sp.]|nr:DUF2927 domain-containing protein [Methanoregula sp.]
MNTGWAFILSGIIIIAVGVVWILTGSPAPGVDLGNLSLPVATPAPVISPFPTNTTPAPVTPEIPVPQATTQLSSDEIKMLFMDLAYGPGNAYLERWDAMENNGRIVISITANNNADIPLLVEAIRVFNSQSQTNQVSEQIKEGSTGDITIKFIAANGFDGIVINPSEFLTNREFKTGNLTTAKITHGTIYLNGNLKGDLRNHTLIRSIFYELGFVGDTQKYPDSLFYAGENTNINLTDADRKAIEIMYGSGLTHGMTVDDVKRVVYIR